MGSPFPGPTPIYSNPPIKPQNFKPKKFDIFNITLGLTTIVQTVNNMDYVIGQLVRLLIPSSWGSFQLNEVTAYVLSIVSPNEVELDLNSSQNVNAFKTGSQKNIPQIIPVGDINSGIISSTGNINFSTTIPGSFINIS